MNNMSDGVGKKIVEALKMHDNVVEDETITEDIDQSVEEEEIVELSEPDNFSSQVDSFSDYQNSIEVEQIMPTNMFTQSSQSSVDAAFQQSLVDNLGSAAVSQIADDFDYPSNVAVLKQLIAKLPAGVSKQTGAIIIKQTMEALGISMSSVLQEAKQVQETFVSNARECQNNIVEYRKQICTLEQRVQQYQKQSVVMNDIINLFLQTGIR